VTGALSLLLAFSVGAQPAASASLAGRPLADALTALQSSGLKIVFSSQLVRPEMKVVAEPKETSPRRRLDEVLRPHGLMVRETRGSLVVVKSPKPRLDARAGGGTGTIRGRVIEARTGVPLTAVLLQVSSTNQRALSDEQGRFELTDVPAGKQVVLVSVVGYGLVRRDVVVAVGAVLELEIPVAEGASTYVEEVTVPGSAFRQIETGVASQSVLGSRDLQALRGLLADDPFRAVQTLPGVATGNDFRAEFAVRGQGPRHVGLSIDGVDSPLLFHTVRGVEDGGSLALINSDVLDSASIVAGARPQRLNAHLGPAVDFEMRDGAADRLSVRGMVSVTAATTVWEGPFGNGTRGSWLVAARQSYLDWLLRAVDPESSGTFGFTDVQAKLAWRIRDRQTLRLTLIGGRSMLHEREEAPNQNGLEDGANRTLIASLQWQLSPTPALHVSQQIYGIGASYENRMTNGGVREGGSDRDLTWKGRVEWMPAGTYLVEVGGQAQASRATRVDRSFGSFGAVTNFDISGRTSAAAGWTHMRWQPVPRLIISPGVRVDRWNITDSTLASPWLLAEWQLTPDTRLRGGLAIQRQAPLIEQAETADPSAALRPERAQMFDVGVERRLDERWQVNVNAFYRTENDRLRLVDGEPHVENGTVVFTPAPLWRNTMTGEAGGLGLSLERRSVNGVSGWLGYSFERADLSDATTGETFPSDWDQRHALNAYAIYRHSSRTSFSARLRIGSNFPLPGYFREVNGQYFLGSEKNQLRLPTYSRLDVRADRSFTYQRRRLTLFVEAINVFNRTNVAPAEPSISFPSGRVQNVTEELFPLLPMAGVLIEF
jgi:hypothetical protein